MPKCKRYRRKTKQELKILIKKIISCKNKIDRIYCYSFFFSFTDHHKSWQIFQIFLYAMSAEMMVPYVQRSLASHLGTTVDGFLDSLLTPNEKCMYNIIFNFSLAFHVFRAGVRRNNSDAILSSRSVFSPFFGLNMSFYM